MALWTDKGVLQHGVHLLGQARRGEQLKFPVLELLQHFSSFI